jgi:hypothetical protein
MRTEETQKLKGNALVKTTSAVLRGNDLISKFCKIYKLQLSESQVDKVHSTGVSQLNAQFPNSNRTEYEIEWLSRMSYLNSSRGNFYLVQYNNDWYNNNPGIDHFLYQKEGQNLMYFDPKDINLWYIFVFDFLFYEIEEKCNKRHQDIESLIFSTSKSKQNLIWFLSTEVEEAIFGSIAERKGIKIDIDEEEKRENKYYLRQVRSCENQELFSKFCKTKQLSLGLMDQVKLFKRYHNLNNDFCYTDDEIIREVIDFEDDEKHFGDYYLIQLSDSSIFGRIIELIEDSTSSFSTSILSWSVNKKNIIINISSDVLDDLTNVVEE